MTELTPCAEDRRGAELICVCCHCRRERTAAGEWREHTARPGERLTHGICPACVHKLYPEIAPLVYPSA